MRGDFTVNGSMFIDGWYPVLRIVVVGTLSYIAVVGLLRYFGKRALSKMNAFDLVVTVAIGSALASAVVSKNVTLVDGGCVCPSARFAAYICRARYPAWPVRAIFESATFADRVQGRNLVGCGQKGATRQY